jgi:hypothetical protein
MSGSKLENWTWIFIIILDILIGSNWEKKEKKLESLFIMFLFN